MICRVRMVALAVAAFCVLPAALATAGVENTVHNLSISGPGDIKAVNEQEVCIFCHTTHNTKGQGALWNRELSEAQYKIYKSGTLRKNGAPQPDGASKLCLSCHDGTIALGKVLSRGENIALRNIGGRGEIPQGRRSNLGTDLSGMHPLSVAYGKDDELEHDHDGSGSGASKKVGVETSLVASALIPKDFLDKQRKVQCTTCHDPHEDRFSALGGAPRFWRRSTVSEVCEACHIW